MTLTKGPFTHRTTSYVNLYATTDDVVRCCPLSSVVARQITCIGMLMICKYSSEMAEYAVADVVMAAATFLWFSKTRSRKNNIGVPHVGIINGASGCQTM